MRTALRFVVTAKALVRPALWFCALNLLMSVLGAQCTNPTQVPNGTYTSGDHSATANNALSAASFVISGSATATFVAGHCIELSPGFRATAGTAPTTFHAWAETAPSVVSVVPPTGSSQAGVIQPFTWTVSDPSGADNLEEIQMLIDSSSTSANCYMRFSYQSKTLSLNDPTNGWQGSLAQGTGSLSNSACTIGGGFTFGKIGANQFAVTVPVTFQAPFSGVKNNSLIAYDIYGLNSSMQQVGSWSVIVPADFSLSVNPAVTNSNLIPGQSYSGTIATGSVAGFTYPATFSYRLTSVPNVYGLGASIDANGNFLITTHSNDQATNFPSGTPGGKYTIVFTVTGAGVSHDGTISFTVVNGACTANPTMIAGLIYPAQPNNQAVTYNITGSGGTGPLSYTYTPSGNLNYTSPSPTAYLINNFYNVTMNPQLWISTAAGIAAAKSDGAGFISVPIACTAVLVTPSSGVSLSVAQYAVPAQPLKPGGPSLTFVITARSIGNYSGSVTLTPSFPAGLVGSLVSNSIYVQAGSSNSTTFTLSAPLSALPRTYNGSIGYIASGFIVPADFTVQVVQDPGIYVTNLATAAPTPGSTIEYGITISNPGNGLFTVGAPTGLPTGTTVTFSDPNAGTSNPLSGTTSLLIMRLHTSSNTPTGTYAVHLTAKIDGVTCSACAGDATGTITTLSREYIRVNGRVVADINPTPQ
jgi:hypothetical protein